MQLSRSAWIRWCCTANLPAAVRKALSDPRGKADRRQPVSSSITRSVMGTLRRLIFEDQPGARQFGLHGPDVAG